MPPPSTGAACSVTHPPLCTCDLPPASSPLAPSSDPPQGCLLSNLGSSAADIKPSLLPPSSPSLLQGCLLSNLGSSAANIKNCVIIYQSLSDTVLSTVKQLQGIAFPDDMCLVIANNGGNPRAINMQMFQYYDCEYSVVRGSTDCTAWVPRPACRCSSTTNVSEVPAIPPDTSSPCTPSPPHPSSASRYYGTVFSIILTIILFGGVLIYICYTCYSEFVSSTDRIVELRSFEAQLNGAPHETAAEAVQAEDASDPGTFSGRVKIALTKARNLITRTKEAIPYRMGGGAT